MEKLTELLAQLAAKFGTTVEHLWSIMIRQAYISSILDIIFYILFIINIIACYKVYRYCYKTDKFDNSRYYNNEETLYIPMFLWALLSVILIIVMCTSITSTITGLINPEYWTLKQILHKCN